MDEFKSLKYSPFPDLNFQADRIPDPGFEFSGQKKKRGKLETLILLAFRHNE